jgi:thiamine-phosphate pyrophosphorylase
VNFPFPPIYPITDIAISGLPVPEQIRRMIAGGAKLIQVRAKTSTSREFFDAAAEAVRLAHAAGVRIIINDRVDIAMMTGADGVHLGQEDLSPLHARRLMGENAIIGFSTHDLKQAKAAAQMPIDYLAYGPVFPTATKEDPDPVVGLGQLVEVKRIAGHLPVIAIGGINEANVQQVLAAGADSAAVISAVLSHTSGVEEAVRAMYSRIA